MQYTAISNAIRFNILDLPKNVTIHDIETEGLHLLLRHVQECCSIEHCLGSADPAYLQRSIRQAIERAKAFPTFGSKGPTQSMLFPNRLQRTLLTEGRLIAAAIYDGLRATCFCLCSFLIGHLDWGMEPVRLDDQEVARQVLKDSFGRCTDEYPLPAISRHGAHHDYVSVKFIRCER